MAATKNILVNHMLDLPAMAAPPGLTHNDVNPPDMEAEYYIAVILSLTISLLVVCMRMWTKAQLIQKFGKEDWVCLLAFVRTFHCVISLNKRYIQTIFIGYCVYAFYFLISGSVGVHQWNVQIKSLSDHLYHVRVAAAVYCFAVFTIKLAILLEFLRIFSLGRSNNTFWICHTLIWLNFLFYVIVSFLFISYSLASQFKNLSILILPQKVIWSLQMSLKRRTGVSAIFLAGLFACFTSVIRLYYSIQIVTTGDFTYNVASNGFWGLGELASGFIAMCLPVSPRFFQGLKQITMPSWISISGPLFRQCSKTEDYLSQFNLPRRLPRRSTFSPTKQAVPPIARSVGFVSGDHTPADGSSSSNKLESDNLHIIRGVEVSTMSEPVDFSTPVYLTYW